MTTPVFNSRDPREPGFWSERFEQDFMPWDRAGVPLHLRHFVMQAPVPRATLIPGCGLGHEVGFLAEAGWDVCAIDFSATAVAQARAGLGGWGEHVVEADFFTGVMLPGPSIVQDLFWSFFEGSACLCSETN